MLFHLETIRFEIKEVATPNTNDFKLSVSHKIMHNLKDERLKVLLSILLTEESENEALTDFDFHFNIKELKSFYKLNENGTPIFSAILIATLLSIAFSTARGVLYERLSNTIFIKALLPIISPQKMLADRKMT